jgi:hypothetical protein
MFRKAEGVDELENEISVVPANLKPDAEEA